MSGPGFDWLNIAGLKSDSELPPPPVSFGVSPASSTSSVNLLNANNIQNKTNNSQISLPEESVEDLKAPLSLTADQLTRDEAKTYLRWYNDLVVRKGTKLIRLYDVFQYLNNFKLSEKIIKTLEKIFKDCISLNIGEFFALLRVIAHTIIGETPRRKLTSIPAPLLKPRSILSRKRFQESNEEEYGELPTSQISGKLDLDTFTQFLMTGEKPDPSRKKKKLKSKRVMFKDEVSVEPTDLKPIEPLKIDLSLPMDQLLQKLPPKSQNHQQQINEEEELKDLQESMSHFQNVNVDSALIHGVPSTISSSFFEQLGSGLNSPDPSSQQQQQQQQNQLSPNPTGTRPTLLAPNHTGPVPFGDLKPDITGSTSSNNHGYLSPNYTGNTTPQPLTPSVTGSLSNSMRQNFGLRGPSLEEQQQIANSLQQPDLLTNSLSGRISPNNPPPPPHRLRSTSSPLPVEPHPQHLNQFSGQYSLQLTSNSHRTPSPLPPPPPPSRRNRGSSISTSTPPPPPPPPSRSTHSAPVLPPKIQIDSKNPYNQPIQFPFNGGSNQSSNSSSTVDILGDLKALQNEVEKLQYYHG
ncbi:hypothetical protein WICMUC_004545 [Wickerhamomyces mucosus]|uniref:Protein SCD5 n=1 Tax=Wickerhamomyces mucosus TaxID=1378264 RepID=A0A9P8PIB2_9ASCO|nr:hypothetical protein WICMUC_004545 [Wickerhamomyces mucosus]